ncbi:esterase/lipase family protein [Aliivibrio fischeri]|uniref:esterase/lipase family protein n=1 Tax=Aliivibrio fischeri TaxID=668 RepID=UPI0009BB6C2C|nr:hypothetical protein [Aliivibrio fischeri]
MKKVVFVHGLGGDLNKTWGNFPSLIDNDPELECSSVTFGYECFYWPFVGASASLHNIAEALESEIRLNCDEEDELVLVGHSLGGLVIKKFLLNQIINKNRYNFNIKKVCFFAVPHEGSGLSEIRKLVGWRNQQLKVLAKDSKYIEEFNDVWEALDATSKFEFLSVIGSKDSIVTSNSSKSLFRGCDIITLNEKGHVNIVKPEDVNDNSFRALKKFIESKRSVEKYTNIVSENYRDWLAHDNGRSHGYSFVTDDARIRDLNSLQDALKKKNSLVRITGLSGLGKTRLITEYIDSYLKEENVIIFNATSHENEIKKTIKEAIKDKAYGLVIIEHCSLALHDYLVVELRHNSSNLRIITVNFYDENVTNSPYIHLTKLDDTSVTSLIKPVLPQFDDEQLRRIVSFVEGFPLLAILIAERFRDQGVLSAELTERGFAEKLINADGKLSDEHKHILQVCSLFDVFGIEDNAIEQADYIIGLANSNRTSFGQVMKQFTDRKIINRVGCFARIVPKPLATHLASTWWDNNIQDELENLINTLPDSLFDSFCTQIKYLDSSPKVREFVNKIYGDNSPFGQAELLLSTKGSNLFRALVEVNPEATSLLLYRTFKSISDEQIKEITGDVRRNLVWALEMLVFHDALFEKSSWCLFKLAQFENESYSNNATGQFSQLFRWQLSGTQANFEQRLTILNNIVKLNIENADLVVIEAIRVAIDSHGGSRTLGAEFQGTKAELEEWRPKVWQEIFDYWEALLDIYLSLVKKTHLADAVKTAFGHQIRGLIKYIPLSIIDGFIKKVVASSGKYWPSAAQSIAHTLHFDLKSLKDQQLTAIREWENLLSPDDDNLEEQLMLVVLNPSRDYEEGEDGHYIDVAAEGAIALAHELKERSLELEPFFGLLMTFPEQKQTWVFAKEVALCSTSVDELLDNLLKYLRLNGTSNTRFISGFLYGLYVRSPTEWDRVVKLFGSDNQLYTFYPDAMTSGHFNEAHLNEFISLIKDKHISIHASSILIYGSVSKHLSEREIAKFCLELSKLGENSTWIALHILSMYTHGRSDYDYDALKPTFIELVLATSFKKEDKHGGDVYHWHRVVERLLEVENEEFAAKLCQYLIFQVANNDVGYSDLWDYLHESFYKAFELHGKYIWPLIQHEFIGNEGIKRYRLIELLGSGKERHKQSQSVFTLLDKSQIIEWCKKKEALLIVARTLTLFEMKDEEKTVNSLLLNLIEYYGNNELLYNEISANYHSRLWSGSLVPYLEKDKECIEPFKMHKNGSVQQWATDFCSMLDEEIIRESKRDADEAMLRNFHN